MTAVTYEIKADNEVSAAVFSHHLEAAHGLVSVVEGESLTITLPSAPYNQWTSKIVGTALNCHYARNVEVAKAQSRFSASVGPLGGIREVVEL